MNKFMLTKQGGVVGMGLVLLAILVLGGVGYAGYQARVNKTAPSTTSQTRRGTVTQNDCRKSGGDCYELSLRTDTGDTYGLVGPRDAKPFVGQAVTVKGSVTGPAPAPAINVADIQPDSTSTQTRGTLSISVYCTEKIDPQPCATSIRVEDQNSAQGNLDPYIPTDASGHLSISLLPGSYFLTPEAKPNYPMFVPPHPNPVTVSAGQVTNIAINYHDGTK